MAMLEVNCLEKIYKTRLGGNQVQALWDVSFSVEQGEYVAIMGESGSGKTTLLNILAALDRPTSGSVLLNGCDVTDLPEKEISKFRRDHLGFVFQDFNLLDTFSLRDNIYLPMVLAGKKPEEMKAKAEPLAKRLGIEDVLDKFPYEVSGGQKQRAAGQTILMVTHSTKAASHASRVLFIKDGEVFHQLYRGNSTNEEMYQKIANTLTLLTTGGDENE